MNKKITTYLALLLLGMSSYSCKKDPTIKVEETIKAEAKVAVKTYNPYSLENMRKAAASLLMKDVQLVSNNKAKYAHGKILFSNNSEVLTIDKSLTAKESSKLAEKELLATHYYIKFMPANEADLAKLKADTNLNISISFRCCCK
jgi:endoglucanase Acf2